MNKIHNYHVACPDFDTVKLHVSSSVNAKFNITPSILIIFQSIVLLSRFLHSNYDRLGASSDVKLRDLA